MSLPREWGKSLLQHRTRVLPLRPRARGYPPGVCATGQSFDGLELGGEVTTAAVPDHREAAREFTVALHTLWSPWSQIPPFQFLLPYLLIFSCPCDVT